MSIVRKAKDATPLALRRAVADLTGVRNLQESLARLQGRLETLEKAQLERFSELLKRLDRAEHSRADLREYLEGLEEMLRPIVPALDGLPLPPLKLMYAVAGNYRTEWFLRSGKAGAESIRAILEKNGIATGRLKSLLDFGCGSGRVIRHWISLKGTKVYGADYNPQLIEWCRENLAFAQFEVNDLAPPLAYEDEKFDLIYALSVFTHLPESLQHDWMKELFRVLKPGGYLVISLHGEHYLEVLDPQSQQQFLHGVLVVHRDDVAGTNVCAAYHPKAYVRAELARAYELVDFIPEGSKGTPSQDLYLFRKPPATT